jgi:hypothetical protein
LVEKGGMREDGGVKERRKKVVTFFFEAEDFFFLLVNLCPKGFVAVGSVISDAFTQPDTYLRRI